MFKVKVSRFSLFQVCLPTLIVEIFNIRIFPECLNVINNSTFVSKSIQSSAKIVACCISNNPRLAYLVLGTVAMCDSFFQQRANIGIIRSCMRWYVRKNYLTWVKTTELLICCARKMLSDVCILIKKIY